jgi:ribosomal protein L37AE/L43A
MSADLPSPAMSAGAHGSARWKCNACGKTVTRRLGWKLWTKSYCEATGRDARLYRVSVPIGVWLRDAIATERGRSPNEKGDSR